MEQKIIRSLLKAVGVHNPTSEDFQRVCGIVRVDRLPTKMKIGLWLLIPTVGQYLEYLMTPEEVNDND